MNRRAFLAALGIAAPAVAAPRRVYSFLWDNPLVTLADPYEVRMGRYPELVTLSPGGWRVMEVSDGYELHIMRRGEPSPYGDIRPEDVLTITSSGEPLKSDESDDYLFRSGDWSQR